MKANKFLAVLALGGAVLGPSPGCRTPRPAAACCAPSMAPAVPLGERSIYQVDSKWRTDTGKALTLAELRGRPQVVVLFFANCQYACPLLVHDLRRIEAGLSPGVRAKTGFLLVTIDPRRDTVEALAAFRASRGLPARSWTLLQGESDDILELAALLGVKYKEEASGQFAHSNLITVLDSEGEIAHQVVGLGQDLKPVIGVLESLVSVSCH